MAPPLKALRLRFLIYILLPRAAWPMCQTALVGVALSTKYLVPRLLGTLEVPGYVDYPLWSCFKITGSTAPTASLNTASPTAAWLSAILGQKRHKGRGDVKLARKISNGGERFN